MFACAEKSASGYVMSYRYGGNGPTEAQRVAMAYPVAAERSGIPAHYDAVLQVRADGSAVFEELVRRDKAKRYDADFRRAMSQWAQAQRFLPEVVDGAAVATRVRTGIDFVLTSRGQPYDPVVGAPDCATAFQRNDAVYGKDESIDSPVKVSP